MKLKEFILVPEERDRGIQEVRMKRLGQVVCLVGPNGSGKSRVLGILETMLRTDPSKYQKAEKLHSDLQKAIGRMTQKREDVTSQKMQLKQVSEDVVRLQHRYSSKIEQPIPLTKLVPENVVLSKYGDYSENEIRKSIDNFQTFLSDGGSPLAVVRVLDGMARSAYQASLDKESATEFEVGAAMFNETKKLISIFSKLDLGYIKQGIGVIPTIDNLVFNSADLSPGQQLLLYYAICLVHTTAVRMKFGPNKGNHLTLQGSIVIIDEPELHLHTSAVINFIARLREVVGDDGQIWIATHSVPLVASLKYGELWLVEDSKVVSPTIESTPRAVAALVGNEHVDKFYAVIQQPWKYAAERFIIQCLSRPSAVEHSEADPQTQTLTEVFSKRSISGGKIRVLDIGAGKGRLAHEIKKQFNGIDLQNIIYSAVEPNISLHSQLRDSAEGMNVTGCYESVYDSALDDCEKYDIILMCNVLHEILPDNWSRELSRIRALANPETGALIVAEVRFMKNGELPNPVGFIVLEETELALLFNVDEAECTNYIERTAHAGKLLLFEIPIMKYSVTPTSVMNTLERVSVRSMEVVDNIRNMSKMESAEEGRRYAYYSQLYINSMIGLRNASKNSQPVYGYRTL